MEMLALRRWMALLMILLLLPVPARAEEEKYIALTFDDGPSGRFTKALLDGLAERNAKATFLLCGYRLETYPELARRMVEEGHEIGLHGYSHDCMGCMSCATLRRELEQTQALLPEGYEPVFLRPPGGVLSREGYDTAGDMGLGVLIWNVDPRDWATSDQAAVVRSVVGTVKDGDVVLMHDMSDSSVAAALEIIDTLSAQGYQFVTVSQLAALRGVTVTPGREYSRFPPCGQ